MKKLLFVILTFCAAFVTGQTILQPKGGGTGFGSYNSGDMLYATGQYTFGKLPAGSNGKVLTISGGLPSWQSLSAGTPTLTATQIAFGSGSSTMTSDTTFTWNNSRYQQVLYAPLTQDGAISWRLSGLTTNTFTAPATSVWYPNTAGYGSIANGAKGGWEWWGASVDDNTEAISLRGTFSQTTAVTGYPVISLTAGKKKNATQCGSLGLNDRMIGFSRDVTGDTINSAVMMGSGALKLGDGISPSKMLEVLDPSNAQLRLTSTNGSAYTDFQTTGGNLQITPSLAASGFVQIGSGLIVNNNFKMNGSTSGSLTFSVPAVAGSNNIAFPAATGTVPVLGSAASSGFYLISTGASSNPTWSALQLGNSATANYVRYATATNILGESSNFQFDNSAPSTPRLFIGGFSSTNPDANTTTRLIVGDAASSNLGVLNLIANTSGTSNTVGAIAGANYNISGTDKRVCGINLTLDGAINSGRIDFWNYSAGSFAYNGRFQSNGNFNLAQKIYVGSISTTPTALIHVAAGTATANTAPFKMTSGTNLATPEDGAWEYNGSNYFATVGSTRYQVAKTLTGSATLDFPSTLAQTDSDLTMTVTGAADGDPVDVGVPNGSAISGGCYTAWVSASNTVTIRFSCYGVTAKDPASGTFKVTVFKN